MTQIAVVGPGRAGRSLGEALKEVGHEVTYIGRSEPLSDLSNDYSAVLIATPDSVVSQIAAQISPGNSVVMHVSGSLSLDVLLPHEKRASMHPLATLPNFEVGKRRILSGCYFATSGDPIADKLVSDLGGFSFKVPDENRGLYHLGATIASNYVVALLGQAFEIAELLSIDKKAILNLTLGAIDDVALLGPREALTGPAARKDRKVLELHQKYYSDVFPDLKELFPLLVKLAQELKEGNGAH